MADNSEQPGYCNLLATGELFERIAQLSTMLTSCELCPRTCGVDRCGGERGYCHGGARPAVASAGPHFGEEPPISGRKGSGTIFFTHCTMRCAYCQNYAISQLGEGGERTCRELAHLMLHLQRQGCHNINLVTPTHYLPQIIEATTLAAQKGLAIPLVYNTGGYDRPEVIRLLEGIVDIYMPDAKYGADQPAQALSGAPGYVAAMQSSLREMHRQVGDLSIGKDGIARRGVLIRHLVLPGDAARSREVIDFIARDLSVDSYVNIMDQYRPAGRILDPGYDAALHRPLSRQEYAGIVSYAVLKGLHRGFIPP
ncbi:MAG: radical SAM protein [Methanomicrobiales archaeon]|nr:radical SAM protein [Methanomicrobiales archaeon]